MAKSNFKPSSGLGRHSCITNKPNNIYNNIGIVLINGNQIKMNRKERREKHLKRYYEK